MKKIISLLLVLVLVLSFAACTTKEDETTTSTTTTAASGLDIPDDAYIALVTDVGNIDDQSFNQGTWEGVVEFAEANNVEHKYYRPANDTDEDRIETIKTAIENGATVVVCPGYMFAAAAVAVQDDYPNVNFIYPDVGEYDMTDAGAEKINDNVALITYQEEQAGYLAGYAAVKDGYTKLGFLGGMDVPAVIRYGFGYVQGADAAAKELGNTADVSVKYWYSGSFAPTDDIQTKMSGWYTEGTEVVFACGGGIYLSATAAAEAADQKVIGVDVDQAGQSDLIITSAMKELGASVISALTDLYDGGTWEFGGKESKLGAAEGAVGLPTAASSWRLETYTVSEYEELFAKLSGGEIEVSNDIENQPTVDITVDYQS